MTLDESVHGMRLRVIERAQVQGNVSAVCRELGISRTVFYRRRQRLERYGVDGVHPRRQRAHAGRPVATAPVVFCRSHDIGSNSPPQQSERERRPRQRRPMR